MVKTLRAVVAVMPLTIYPSRTPSWDMILTRLRSGDVIQTRGALCRLGPEGQPAYCPMGLIALLSGADFQIHGSDDAMCDDDGETLKPSDEVLEPLGLTKEMTDEELDSCWQHKNALLFVSDGTPTRADYIAFLNDFASVKFEKIADEIERLNWNDYNNA